VLTLLVKYKTLIAERLDTRPAEITDRLIEHHRLTRKVQPVLDTTNPYGGHVSDGLRHLTDEEAALATRTFEDMVASARK
jgi:hypothetical protein